jgi:hypothetical protein
MATIEKKNKHSASGSFAGYLFQIERLLFWLSISDVEIVALETEDDIVANLKGSTTNKILEQAKNSTGSKVPYSDLSVDLWKTLSIWVAGVSSGKIDLDKSSFSLVSNKKLPSSRLIKQLVDAKDDATKLNSLLDILVDKAKNNKAETLKPFCEVILGVDKKLLSQVVSKVSIISPETATDIRSLKQHVRSNFGISDKLPFDYMYNDLLGFVVNHVIQVWKKNQTLEISRELMLRRVSELIASYHGKSFIERTVDLLPLSNDEVERNRGKLFVEQLREIKCDEEDIIKAINDFLRASIEKLRYAEDGEILDSHFQRYYEDLKEHWQSIYKPRCRIMNGISPEDIGYEIYHSTTQYRGKLNSQEPEQSYTYKGAYHYLANLPEIGWYPDWDKKFKK